MFNYSLITDMEDKPNKLLFKRNTAGLNRLDAASINSIIKN